MVNTGLLLRRPYESNYAAFRRFLVANQFETPTGLKAELQACGESSARIPGKPWIAPKAQEWERRFCSANGLAFTSATPIDHRDPLRNCPVCAAQCYHSFLFQYPWATKCPIHDQALTTTCPSCKQPWPSPSELLKRYCRYCSARLSLAHLAGSNSFSERMDTRHFDAVNAALEQFDQTRRPVLSAKYAGINQYGNHSCVRTDHQNWPSLVAHNDSTLQAAFRAFGAELFPVQERTFDIGPVAEDTKTNRFRETRWETRLSSWFDAYLREQLRHRFGAEAVEGSVDFLFANRYSVAHVVYLCHINWSAVVNQPPRRRSHLPYVSGCELFAKREFGMPGTPCFVTHVGEDILSSPELFALSGNSQPRQLSRQLQVWLYRCDLWWTFLAMLRYLDVVAVGITNGWGWQNIFRKVQGDGDPNAWYRPRYFIRESEDGQLLIRVPGWVANVDESDLRLKLEDL